MTYLITPEEGQNIQDEHRKKRILFYEYRDVKERNPELHKAHMDSLRKNNPDLVDELEAFGL